MKFQLFNEQPWRIGVDRWQLPHGHHVIYSEQRLRGGNKPESIMRPSNSLTTLVSDRPPSYEVLWFGLDRRE